MSGSKNKYAIALAACLTLLLTVASCYEQARGLMGDIDPQGATALLQKQGYRDIIITGKGRMTDCDPGGSEHPTYYRTRFAAATQGGLKVAGTVCKTDYQTYDYEIPEHVVIFHQGNELPPDIQQSVLDAQNAPPEAQRPKVLPPAPVLDAP